MMIKLENKYMEKCQEVALLDDPLLDNKTAGTGGTHTGQTDVGGGGGQYKG